MTTTHETLAPVAQFNVTSRTGTKTVTTLSASAALDLGDYTFTLFQSPKILDYVRVLHDWTSDKSAPTASDYNTYFTVYFYSVLANGKKGSKWDKRDMSLQDLHTYTSLPAAAIDALAAQFNDAAAKAAN
jgi:hypothetical protein